jgi:hypothetical protein
MRNQEKTVMKNTIKTIIIISLLCGLVNMALAKEIDQISSPVTIEPLITEAGLEILVVDTPGFSLDAAPVEPQISLPRFDLDIHKPSLGDSLFTASLVTFAATNVADYFSTVEALKYPGLREANPLMKPFVKNDLLHASVKVGLSALNIIFLKNLYKRNKTLAWVVSTAANIAMSYVVFNNINHIQRAKAL